MHALVKAFIGGLLALLLIAAPAYAGAAYTNFLLSLYGTSNEYVWPLEANATEIANAWPTTTNGTVTFGVTMTAYLKGFTVNSTGAIVPNNINLNPQGHSWTLMFWANPGTGAAAGNHYFSNTSALVPGTDFYVGGACGGYLETAQTNDTGFGVWHTCTLANVNDGHTHFFVLACDGGAPGSCNFYTDAILQGTVTHNDTAAVNQPVRFGNNDTYNNAITGSMGNLAFVYAQVTQAQVTALYRCGIYGVCTSNPGGDENIEPLQ